MGFLFEWGTIDGASIRGITLITTVFSHGPEVILKGASDPGGGILMILLPLAVTLPAMILAAQKIRPVGRLPPLVCLLAGAWGGGYLLYSALLSKALMGFHGIGFGISLIGFTLISIGGALRWPDSDRESARILRDAAARAGAARLPPDRLPQRKVLASLLLPPPFFIFPLPKRMTLGALPPVTIIIVAFNVISFAVLNQRDDFLPRLVPALCFSASDFQLYSLLTSQFLHFGVIHLTMNMLVLLSIGNELERELGWAWFLAFYLAGGALANLVLGTALAGQAVLAAGASGSIATLLGVMLITMPGRRIRLWFFQVATHRTVDFRAGWVLSLYLVLQTVMALLQGWGFLDSVIAYWNHVGGMLYGMVAALLIKRRVQRKLDPQDLDIKGLVFPFTAAAISILIGLIDLFRSAV